MKILVVDDEQDYVKVITMILTLYKPEPTVIPAYSGREALALAGTESPDIILLDVMLPDIDGFEVCRRVRADSDVPIIMLTAKSLEMDKVKGLEVGADDYITKPFGHRELIARVDAALRRAKHHAPAAAPASLACGELLIDFSRRLVTVKGKPVHLTPTEYNLLYHLARNAGRVLRRETLLAKVWGQEYKDERYHLKTYVYRLRDKLERDPSQPKLILTEPGVGYMLKVD